MHNVSCCSSVIEVWTRWTGIFSHGSMIPELKLAKLSNFVKWSLCVEIHRQLTFPARTNQPTTVEKLVWKLDSNSELVYSHWDARVLQSSPTSQSSKDSLVQTPEILSTNLWKFESAPSPTSSSSPQTNERDELPTKSWSAFSGGRSIRPCGCSAELLRWECKPLPASWTHRNPSRSLERWWHRSWG